VVLGSVWLFVVNQMRISYTACDDAETRGLMAVFMVVIALSLASMFYTICVGEEPWQPVDAGCCRALVHSGKPQGRVFTFQFRCN
jgi:hypothetical protein